MGTTRPCKPAKKGETLAKPVTVCELTFPTKGAAKRFFQFIMSECTPGVRVHEEFAPYLHGLIALHRQYKQKIGCGIAYFTYEKNDFGTCGFWITRIDGTRTDFSYLSCLTHKTPTVEAKAGFRHAIEGQMYAFKREAFAKCSTILCAMTGAPLTVLDSPHVDHVIPFDTLLTEFLRERELAIADVAVEPTTDGALHTVLADKALERAWMTWHAERAELRIVSARANLTRPRT